MSEEVTESMKRPHPMLANGAFAFFVSCFFNGILTSTKESVPSLKASLASVGHHWVGHGITVVIFFLIAAAVFQILRIDDRLAIGDGCAVRYTVSGSVVGVLLIIGFYLVH